MSKTSDVIKHNASEPGVSVETDGYLLYCLTILALLLGCINADVYSQNLLQKECNPRHQKPLSTLRVRYCDVLHCQIIPTINQTI